MLMTMEQTMNSIKEKKNGNRSDSDDSFEVMMTLHCRTL